MTFFVFEPDSHPLAVPFIEDARADFAPYYRARQNERESREQVAAELGKLGAYPLGFLEGKFQDGTSARYGFEIRFAYGGNVGVIRAAGLPMRRCTPSKKQQVRVQALLVVRDWLKAAVTAQVFSPGSNPLLPHLLLPDQKTTIGDYILAQRNLPELSSSTIIVEE